MSTLPTHSTENQVSFIGSVARGSFKLIQASGLAVGGVTLMMVGLGGAYVTSMKIKEFYFDEHDPQNMGSYTGYSEFPGFQTGCERVCKAAHTQINWPPLNTTFCESMATKPFDQQPGSFAPASLVTSMGLSSICYISSLYSFLGGISLVGRSIDVFTSIL